MRWASRLRRTALARHRHGRKTAVKENLRGIPAWKRGGIGMASRGHRTGAPETGLKLPDMETRTVRESELVRDPGNPRKPESMESLMALGENMRNYGQKVPLIVFERPDGKKQIVDGHRRVEGGRLAGVTELKAVVLKEKPSEVDLAIIQACLDGHRKNLNAMERSNHYRRIMELKGCSVSELAALLNLPQARISRDLGCQRLVPQLQEKLLAGEIDAERAYLISQAEPEKQLDLVGKSREELRGRKKRSEEKNGKASPRSGQARFCLSEGTMVVVKCGEVTMQKAIEILSATVRELKKGQSQGLTVESQQRVMKDKAGLPR